MYYICCIVWCNTAMLKKKKPLYVRSRLIDTLAEKIK